MIDFTLQPDDGEEYEVKATTRDFLRWEKSGKGKPRSTMALLDELNMTDLYEVAFYASKRTGAFDGSLVDFENAMDMRFDLRDSDGEETDPTKPEASTGA